MKKDCVVITGGNSGLGGELVKLFKQKYDVISISRSKREEIPSVRYFYGDVSDEEFVKSVYEKLEPKYNLKFLINNAATGRFGEPKENNSKKISEVLNGGLVGLILNTTYALPLMEECGGKIVNIMSTAGQKANPNESLYCACKWGARGYTESLKAYYKGTNIKVVGVYPGGMNTAFWDKNRDYLPKEKTDNFMKVEDVAKVIYGNVTNQDLYVSDIVIERK